VPKVQLIEEFRTLFTESAVLRARHIDNLRTLRSSGVSVWFVAQSLDGLPSSDQDEIRTNTGLSITFRSQSAARVLFPHVLRAPYDAAREPDRRIAFQREIESLPQRELILWTKTEPAIRVRALDMPDPVTASGVPRDELIAIFDELLAPHSTIPVAAAQRMLADWRATTLPRNASSSGPAKRPRNPARGTAPSLRDLLGLRETE
jgi:thioesterase domain-containing protein